MTIYEEMIRDAVEWCSLEGVPLPVVWFSGQERADWRRPGVSSAMCALAGRVRRGSGPTGNCGPWTARIVEHDLGPFTVPALAISLEPIDMAAVDRMFGRRP